jgi:GMP synthase (glutamine-hydrolysing)
MMNPRHVLVLQHVAPETPGIVGHALETREIELRYVRPFAGDAVPRELAGAAGLVVMGGPMGVYEAEQYPYLRDEMRLLEQALAAQVPVLGICLGSQLLAHVLGAPVVKGPQKEIGWHRVTLTDDALADPLFQGVESSFVALHWHGDVFDLPRSATALARSQLTRYQAFRSGASAYGFLFHMEATPAILEGMARAFPEELAEVRLTPEAVLAGAAEHLGALSERGSRVFGSFADLIQGGIAQRVSERR